MSGQLQGPAALLPKKRITARCVSPYSTDNDQTQNHRVSFTTALQTKFLGNMVSIFIDTIDLFALTARMADTHGLFCMCQLYIFRAYKIFLCAHHEAISSCGG